MDGPSATHIFWLYFPGKGKKSCNSISVGAFLDDDDMSLEEVKNRQNAARNYSRVNASSEPTISDIGSSERDILSIAHSGGIIPMADVSNGHYENGGPASKNGCCNPVTSDRTISAHRRHPSQEEECLPSPISNLMEEFDKLACQKHTVGDEEGGKRSQAISERENERFQKESTRQLRKPRDHLTKTAVAAGRMEGTKIRTDEKMPLDGRPSAEIDAWSRETKEVSNSELQPKMSPGCSSETSPERVKKLFLLG